MKQDDFQVLIEDNIGYDITMNQSSIEKNSNKFYKIQILFNPAKGKNQCYIWTRWGRVGLAGQNSTQGPFTKEKAIEMYQDKVKQKSVQGNYKIIETSYKIEEFNDTKQTEDKYSKDFQESKLPFEVKQLLKLIFDIDLMSQQMQEIGYDSKKMPLGKLSSNAIQQGYIVLTQLLEKVQQGNDKKSIKSLSSEFYSYIPHDFGFQHMSLQNLDSYDKVRKKLEMLQSLADIQVASNILNDLPKQMNQFDQNYKNLQCEINFVPPISATYKMISDYFKNSHGNTHNTYTMEIINVFETKRPSEQQLFLEQIGNRKLLWHGSRLTNIVSILNEGLKLPPKDAPIQAYMFGKGIYFADCSSKSANYCQTNKKNDIGILCLCDVALGIVYLITKGNINIKENADYYADQLPQGFQSVMGRGKTYPNEQEDVIFEGALVPLGKTKQTDQNINLPLLYNEYIIYDKRQINIKFIIQIKFNHRW